MEQLSAIEAHAMASGSSEDAARLERFERLRARALGEIPAERKRPEKVGAEKLADMGLGMIMVPPKGEPNG